MIVIGCASQGTNAENANQLHDMEQRVNSQALKDSPPPPGEGPSN